MAGETITLRRIEQDASSVTADTPVVIRQFSVMDRIRKVEDNPRIASIGRFSITSQLFHQFFGFCIEEADRHHSLMMRIASHINPKRHLVEILEHRKVIIGNLMPVKALTVEQS